MKKPVKIEPCILNIFLIRENLFEKTAHNCREVVKFLHDAIVCLMNVPK